MTTEISTVDASEQFSLAGLPEDIQKKILQASEILKSSSTVSVNKIRNDAKAYIMPDGTETSSFTGIIVAAKHANVHYAAEYEEGVSNPPDCFAIIPGWSDAPCKDLIPSSDVANPYGTSCGSCPKFEWGSDRGGKGKGKECSEYVLLAVYIPSLGDDLFLVEEKKSNAKVVDGYLANVAQKWGHPIAVNTSFVMGDKGKWAQSFVATGPVTSELAVKLAGRIEEANSILTERVVGAYKRGIVPDITQSTTTSNAPERKGKGR